MKPPSDVRRIVTLGKCPVTFSQNDKSLRAQLLCHFSSENKVCRQPLQDIKKEKTSKNVLVTSQDAEAPGSWVQAQTELQNGISSKIKTETKKKLKTTNASKKFEKLPHYNKFMCIFVDFLSYISYLQIRFNIVYANVSL